MFTKTFSNQKGLIRSAFCLAIALNLLVPVFAFAGPILQSLEALKLHTSPHQSGGFLAPNELHPEKAIPVLKEMKEVFHGTRGREQTGAYLAVGTDRGFIHAGLANSSHLFLLDYDPKTVQFNRINIALLRLSQSREDYAYLRLTASRTEWLKRLDSVSKTERSALAALELPENFGFWTFVRTIPDFVPFHEGRRGRYTSENAKEPFFVGTNYLLNDDPLFAKIQRLAKESKIETALIDFTNPTHLAALEEDLRRANIRISVVDISNSLDYVSDPTRSAKQIGRSLKSMTFPGAYISATAGRPDHWSYLGIDFNYLERADFDFRKEVRAAAENVTLWNGEQVGIEHAGPSKTDCLPSALNSLLHH
jgi:hypothetical protein